MDKINIAEKQSAEEQLWFTALVSTVDNYDIKVLKLEGKFVWYKHDDEDEMFSLLMELSKCIFETKLSI